MTNDAPVREVKVQCQAWRDQGQLQVCFVEVRWMRDDRTGEINVKAFFGCAPDEHTIILYPLQVWESGYWNKTQVKREMAAAERELFAQMAAEGYTRKHLMREVEMKSLKYF